MAAYDPHLRFRPPLPCGRNVHPARLARHRVARALAAITRLQALRAAGYHDPRDEGTDR